MAKKQLVPGRTPFDPEKYIKGSNQIERISDPAEIEQSLKAWEYLKDQPAITHEVVKEVQRLITANQSELDNVQRGDYRKISVRVGGRYAPNPGLVWALMDNFITDMELMTPLVAHVRFEYIHPFVDGNGRTGRMIMWWHMAKAGKDPFYYGKHEREAYYRLFSQRRIQQLKENNWGIPRKQWAVKAKGSDGKFYAAVFPTKPTKDEISAAMPRGVSIAADPLIREVYQ